MLKKLFKTIDERKDNFKEELSFGSFFNYLMMKRKVVAIIVGITVVIVMVYSLIAPFQYRAGATILPPQNASSMGDLTSFLQTLSGGIALGGSAQGNSLLIFKDILKSREAAKIITDKNGLVKRLKVKPQDVDNLYDGIASMLNVELKRSGLILVTAETATSYFPTAADKNDAAELSALIVNSAVQALDSINRVKNTTKARREKEFINRVLAKKQQDLNMVDSLLELFRQQHHFYDLDDQNKALMNNAVELGTRLAQAEIELNLQRLEFNDNSPIVVTAREKYNKLLEQYNRLQAGGIASNDKFSIPLDSVPKLIRFYQDLIRKKKILEQVNLYLSTKKYQSAIQEASDVPTIQPLDLAQVPKHRIAPKRKVMFILALFLSFIAASVFVLIQGVYEGNLIVKREEKSEQSSQ